jgi:hypothetical protein
MYNITQPTTNSPQSALHNILFEGGAEFEQLCEAQYFRDVFNALSRIMKERFKDYLFFILQGDNFRDGLPSSMYFETDKKKVLIFISEESGKTPYHLSPYFHAIFKEYLPLDKFCVTNIFNFPLGCVKDVQKLPIIPINDRRYNLFFSGNLNHGRVGLYRSLLFKHYSQSAVNHSHFYFLSRKSLLKTIVLGLKSNFDHRFPDSYLRFTNGWKKGLSPEKYSEILSNSKIVLCPTGVISSECFRHYEAMRAGCVIISDKLPKTYFYKESPIIQINDWREGLKIAAELQNNPGELERRSRLTLDWYEKRCSEEGVARYMEQCLATLEGN